MAPFIRPASSTTGMALKPYLAKRPAISSFSVSGIMLALLGIKKLVRDISRNEKGSVALVIMFALMVAGMVSFIVKDTARDQKIKKNDLSVSKELILSKKEEHIAANNQ